MKKNSLKTLGIILALGFLAAVAVWMLTGIVKDPTVTEQDFPYTITYRLNGETKTLEGVYRCRYDGHSKGENPRDRVYRGEYIVNGEAMDSHFYTIAENDSGELFIVTWLNINYLMGDKEDESYSSFLEDPYIDSLDPEGIPYDAENMPEGFDAEIISWEYPEPVENTFVFSGFSILHVGSMLAMLAVGLLVILACMIVVKRDKALVPYGILDKLSVLLNFVICFAVIPFVTFCTILLQITMSGDDLLYQICLCVPVLCAFSVAASVVLRRMGYRKSGFFVQFAGPLLFAVPVMLDSFL